MKAHSFNLSKVGAYPGLCFFLAYTCLSGAAEAAENTCLHNSTFPVTASKMWDEMIAPASKPETAMSEAAMPSTAWLMNESSPLKAAKRNSVKETRTAAPISPAAITGYVQIHYAEARSGQKAELLVLRALDETVYILADVSRSQVLEQALHSSQTKKAEDETIIKARIVSIINVFLYPEAQKGGSAPRQQKILPPAWSNAPIDYTNQPDDLAQITSSESTVLFVLKRSSSTDGKGNHSAGGKKLKSIFAGKDGAQTRIRPSEAMTTDQNEIVSLLSELLKTDAAVNLSIERYSITAVQEGPVENPTGVAREDFRSKYGELSILNLFSMLQDEWIPGTSLSLAHVIMKGKIRRRCMAGIRG